MKPYQVWDVLSWTTGVYHAESPGKAKAAYLKWYYQYIYHYNDYEPPMERIEFIDIRCALACPECYGYDLDCKYCRGGRS